MNVFCGFLVWSSLLTVMSNIHAHPIAGPVQLKQLMIESFPGPGGCICLIFERRKEKQDEKTWNLRNPNLSHIHIHISPTEWQALAASSHSARFSRSPTCWKAIEGKASPVRRRGTVPRSSLGHIFGSPVTCDEVRSSTPEGQQTVALLWPTQLQWCTGGWLCKDTNHASVT